LIALVNEQDATPFEYDVTILLKPTVGFELNKSDG